MRVPRSRTRTPSSGPLIDLPGFARFGPACSDARALLLGLARPGPGRSSVLRHELVDHEVVAPRVALAHARSSDGLIDSLTAWAVTGGTSATLVGHGPGRGGQLGAGHDPVDQAERARPRRRRSVSAQSRNSLALRGPSSHGSTSSSTPTPDMRSTGLEKRASSAATIRSHMQASMSPAAEQAPCTAAIVGLAKSRSCRQRSQYMTCSWWSLPSGVARMAAHWLGGLEQLLEVVAGGEVLARRRRGRPPARRRRPRPGRGRRRARR